MRSIVSAQFRKMLEKLPARVQAEARDGFNRWKEDPRSVGWKRLTGMSADVWSVQIGNRYRALGVVSREHNAVAWMFVGSHEDYNQFIDVHRKMSNDRWLAGGGLKERLDARRYENTNGGPGGTDPDAGRGGLQR